MAMPRDMIVVIMMIDAMMLGLFLYLVTSSSLKLKTTPQGV
jgi:hypothetical protein